MQGLLSMGLPRLVWVFYNRIGLISLVLPVVQQEELYGASQRVCEAPAEGAQPVPDNLQGGEAQLLLLPRRGHQGRSHGRPGSQRHPLAQSPLQTHPRDVQLTVVARPTHCHWMDKQKKSQNAATSLRGQILGRHKH